MSGTAVELLTEDERVGLDVVIAGLPAAARSSAEAAYIEGRVAGLCREGALELAADAARDERDEAMSADR